MRGERGIRRQNAKYLRDHGHDSNGTVFLVGSKRSGESGKGTKEQERRHEY